MVQSMGTNDLYDIPQLFSILGLVAFYAFKRSAHVTYAYFNMFFIYYIGYAIVFKWLYLICFSIPFMQVWADKHKSTIVVIVLQALFGKKIQS